LAEFTKDPEIKINGDKAGIHFVLSGQLTHIKVKNCVVGTQHCTTENVMVPQKPRNKRQTTTALHNFVAEVALVNPEAKHFKFYFWFFDGDVLLSLNPYEVKVKKGKLCFLV
jgi:hypothetical protein